MATDTDLPALAQNVKRMLDLAAMLGNEDWAKRGKASLEKLLRKLEALSLARAPKRIAPLETEFYTIVESHPKLRQASRVVFKEELLDICREGLAYFERLKSTRELTHLDLEHLANVRREHARAAEEFEQLRDELLGECSSAHWNAARKGRSDA